MSTTTQRVPLHERINGEWDIFEALLFNLVTAHAPDRLLFSKRLALTQTMLDAHDNFLAQLRRPQ